MEEVDEVINRWRNETLLYTDVDEEEKKMLVCL